MRGDDPAHRQGRLNPAEVTREAFEIGLWRLTYQGRALLKLPTDLWAFAEIIEQTQPEVLVETGSHEGGSAAWFSSQVPEVISIGLRVPTPVDRVTFLQGSSTEVDVEPLVRGLKTMVVLDSDHNAPHVLAEMERLGPLVSSGCYMVVEDTAVDAYGLDTVHYPEGGPGIAVEMYLSRHDGWTQDRRCERFGVGMNPGGWLRCG